MRFNTKAEVKAWAMKAAQEDIKRSQDSDWDLNVYCTPGARNYWKRGFDNAPANPWEHDLDWDTQYQRGRAVAEILAGGKN